MGLHHLLNLRRYNHWPIAPLGLCLVGVSACIATVQPPENKPELPVRKVVLYQNGIGYFERRGEVKSGEVELRVRPDQINDVLKSLSVLDMSGGMASSVSLPVERSGDRLAAELPAQVRNAQGMHGLLAVLRGAEVEVDGQDGTLRGRVVGVESSQQLEDGKPKNIDVLTLMSDDNQLLCTPVAGIHKVIIGDRTLAVGLQQSLDISRSEGAWKPVKLMVRLAGDGTHDLILSYIHEVPIWRPAYRAWVESGKGVQLQGWAIVDNVSGEDWNEVNLTLVVGSPLSFRYNLHTPHNVQRPDLTSRLPQVADAPPEPDSGFGEAPAPAVAASAPEEEDSWGGPGGAGPAKDSAKDSAKKGNYPPPSAKSAAYERPRAAYNRPPAPAQQAQADRSRAEEDARRDAMMRSAQALVSGKEVGALYTYEAQAPITVPDRSAALINIVSRRVQGQDVFLFREPQSGQAPFRAVLLRNDKESALEGGPITLYVDGTFAGEGFIGRIAREETAFIPYARESGFTLDMRFETKIDELRLVRVVDGRITVQGKRLQTRTVSLQSNRDKDSTAYVKLALTAGMSPLNPPKDWVKSGNDVYLPVHVAAKQKAESQLVEMTPVEFVEAGLTGQVLDAFRFYLKGQHLEDAVAGPIRELLANHEEIAAINRESQSLQEQRDILERDSQRIQGNLDSLPQGPVAAQLRAQLVHQMEASSKKLAEVAKKLVECQVKLAASQEKERVLLLSIRLK